MKTEELTALGLNEDQVKQVFALNGKDVEAAKAAKDKTIADLTAERDGLKTRLDTAETTLKKFEGIDPQQIQQEIQTYKTQAEDAEKKFAARSEGLDHQEAGRVRRHFSLCPHGSCVRVYVSGRRSDVEGRRIFRL